MKPRDALFLGLAFGLMAYGWSHWPDSQPKPPKESHASGAPPVRPSSAPTPPPPRPPAPDAVPGASPDTLSGARSTLAISDVVGLDFLGDGVVTADARGRVIHHPPAGPPTTLFASEESGWRSVIVRRGPTNPDRVYAAFTGAHVLELGVAAARVVRSLPIAVRNIDAMAVTPDGASVIACGRDSGWKRYRGAVVMALADGRVTYRTPETDALHVEPTACGERIACYFRDRVEIRALDGRVLRRGPPPRYGWVGYPVSAGGVLLANRVSETEVVVREVANDKVLLRIALTGSADGALAFAPRGELLTVGNGGALEMWDARAGRKVRRVDALKLVGRPDTLGSAAVAFSPDGARLAYVDGPGVVIVR